MICGDISSVTVRGEQRTVTTTLPQHSIISHCYRVTGASHNHCAVSSVTVSGEQGPVKTTIVSPVTADCHGELWLVSQ